MSVEHPSPTDDLATAVCRTRATKVVPLLEQSPSLVHPPIRWYEESDAWFEPAVPDAAG